MIVVSNTSPIMNLAVIGQLNLAVKPLLDDMTVRAGFWVSNKLYARVLREVEE